MTPRYDPNDFIQEQDPADHPEPPPQPRVATPRRRASEPVEASAPPQAASRYPARTQDPRDQYDAREKDAPPRRSYGGGGGRSGSRGDLPPAHGFVREYPSKQGGSPYLFITFTQDAPPELQKYVMNINFMKNPKGNMVGYARISESKPNPNRGR